ncbi:2-dehydro-3-deoxy-6-phosphogalactonate aldolase [Lysobacter sp. CA199]|uniref:2-dehydro-3-deoxy-6-phosphogalactonate aldolase n=1 Tax=Lysobacter sp. CA199 TaxID=3455608 RepID=UPI003F8CF8FA
MTIPLTPAVLHAWLARSPFVAILRGITPDEAVPVGEALWGAGWRIVEVPLNSPDAFESIARLQRRFGDSILLGAGTVRRAEEVQTLSGIGARLMVCPHTDPALIACAKRNGLLALPGAATPSECLAALDAGADALKLFPADALGPAMLAALRAVLPADTAVLPVGGIRADQLAPWRKVGASGFGIGGTLYRPGVAPEQIARTAHAFNTAWEQT